MRHYYSKSLHWCLQHLLVVSVLFVGMLVATVWLLQQLPSEYAPREDRGSFFVIVNGPEGASFSYMDEYMDEIENRLITFVDAGDIAMLLVSAPRGRGEMDRINTRMPIPLSSGRRYV